MELLKELALAVFDLYFKDDERVIWDGYYKIASWCEEGDWQYCVYWWGVDDDYPEEGECWIPAAYFCYYDNCTKEVTGIKEIGDYICNFFENETSVLLNNYKRRNKI